MLKSLQMIRHILFDADQTLYPASSGIEAEMIRRMNIFTSEFLNITIREAAQMRADRDKCYDSTLDWLRRAKGLEDADAFFSAVHPTEFTPFFPKNPALKEMLGRITVPCSILTNSWEKHAANVIEYLEISEHFTRIFDLVFNNYRGKPNVSAFENVLACLALRPDEVLFIDDISRFTDVFSSMGGNVILVDEDMEYGGVSYPRVRKITDIGPVLRKYSLIE